MCSLAFWGVASASGVAAKCYGLRVAHSHSIYLSIYLASFASKTSSLDICSSLDTTGIVVKRPIGRERESGSRHADLAPALQTSRKCDQALSRLTSIQTSVDHF